MGVTLFTLWRLRQESLAKEIADANISHEPKVSDTVSIAFCGAVGEKHPTALKACQETLDVLMGSYGLANVKKQRLKLDHAADSGLLGAAVGAVVNSENTARGNLARL